MVGLTLACDCPLFRGWILIDPFDQIVYGPNDAPFEFGDDYPKPIPMTKDDIQRGEDVFIAAVERYKQIGFDFTETHAAHGYLLSSFLSPLTNDRADEFGGQSLENRICWPLQLMKRVREVWSDKPPFRQNQRDGVVGR